MLFLIKFCSYKKFKISLYKKIIIIYDKQLENEFLNQLNFKLSKLLFENM